MILRRPRDFGLLLSLIVFALSAVGCGTRNTRELATAAAQGTVDGLVKGISEREEPLFENLSEGLNAENPVEDLAANATRGIIRGSREALTENLDENLLVSEVDKVAGAILKRFNEFIKIGLSDLKDAFSAVLAELSQTTEGTVNRLSETTIPALGKAWKETSERDLEPSVEALSARATKGFLDTLALSLEGPLKDATRTYIDEAITPSLAQLADTMTPRLSAMAEQASRSTAKGLIEEFEAFLERQNTGPALAGDLSRHAVAQAVAGFREGMESTYPRIHKSMLSFPDDVNETQGGISRFLNVTGISVAIVGILGVVALLYYIRKSRRTSEALEFLVGRVQSEGQTSLRQTVEEKIKAKGLDKWIHPKDS